jgi:GNAT superfamily N-acetyltransferase
MSLRFELPTEVTPELRAKLIDLITEASNAGGAIGYVAPVDRDEVDAKSLRPGSYDLALDTLLVADETEAGGPHSDGATVAGMLFLNDRRFALMDHTRTLRLVVLHPKHQGKGYGVELLREAERVARTLDGVEMLHLTCRGGLGLEQFYAKCGYTEVGRIPRALRVGADDYRDEIHMVLAL